MKSSFRIAFPSTRRINKKWSIISITAILAATTLSAFPAISGTVATIITCASTRACVTSSNSSTGPGVQGNSTKGNGVYGDSVSGVGVKGYSPRVGVQGDSGAGTGVSAVSIRGHAVTAVSTTNETVGTALSAQANGGAGIVSTVNGATDMSGNCGLGAVTAISNFASADIADSSAQICLGIAQGLRSPGVAADGNPGLLGTAHQTANKGSPATAVEGIGDTGGRFVADGGFPDPFILPNALEVEQDGAGLVISAFGTGGGMSLDKNGNLVISGTLTQHGQPSSHVIPGKPTSTPVLSGDQNAPTIEKVGEGHITSGQGYVRLDAALAKNMDLSARYEVFITPEGPSAGLYVNGKSSNGFAVRENPGGHSTVDFSYRVIAKAQQPSVQNYGNGQKFKRFDRHIEEQIIARLKATAQQYRKRR